MKKEEKRMFEKVDYNEVMDQFHPEELEQRLEMAGGTPSLFVLFVWHL